RRHWPVDLYEGRSSFEANVRAIAERLALTISAITATHPTTLLLTAGSDSRVLLACARPVMHRLDYLTSAIDDAARWDAKIARRISHRLKLNHAVLSFLPPTDDERRQWLASTGYSIGGRVSHGFKTIAEAVAGRVVVLGLAGEVGRAYYGAGVTAA